MKRYRKKEENIERKNEDKTQKVKKKVNGWHIKKKERINIKDIEKKKITRDMAKKNRQG